MNNNLLHVSAVALQKSLEKDARAASLVDQDNLSEEIAEEQTSSMVSRLLHWFDHTKPTQPHGLAPKLKNKIV